MQQQPIVLFLTSTSMHFPLDLQAVLVNEGQTAKRIDSLDDFLSTPDRHTPYLAVLEIGSTDDLERALLAYEWCEKVLPLAPCRVLLLIASKNIELGSLASRFGTAEVSYLPLPLKNLLFKVDLQKRLLFSDQNSATRTKKESAGFSAKFVDRPPKMERVLLVRGPGPQSGYWQEAGNSPQGKVRWRWIATPKSEAEKENAALGISWMAESAAAPVYEEMSEAWAIEDPEAELLGFKNDQQIFSAIAAEAKLLLPKEEMPVVETPAPTTATERPKIEAEAGSSPANRASLTAPARSLPSAEKTPASPGAPQKIQDPKAKEASPIPAPKPRAQEKEAKDLASGPSPAGEGKPGSTPSKPAWMEPEKPAWNVHEGRTVSEPSAKKQTAALPEEKSAPPKKEEKTAAAEANEPKKTQDSIPESHGSDENEDSTGYSVSVPTIANEKVERDPDTRKDEVFSHRHQEIPQSQAEYQQSARDAAGASTSAKQEAELLGEEKKRPSGGADTAILAEKKAGEKAPEALAKKKPPEKSTESSAPAQKIGSTEENTPPGSRTSRTIFDKQQKPDPTSTQRIVGDPARAVDAGSIARGSTPAQLEKVNVKGEKETENFATHITVDGATARSEEEVRIRAAVQEERAASRSRKSPEAEDSLKYRHFVTMTLEELNDRQSSWHPVDKYRIYVSAYHRYYVVKDPNVFLPLWVYEGELAPEFLEEKQAWKFYDRYPELYSTLDTLPPIVLEHVYGAAGIFPSAEKENARMVVSAQPGKETLPEESKPDSASGPKGIWGGVIRFVKKLFAR